MASELARARSQALKLSIAAEAWQSRLCDEPLAFFVIVAILSTVAGVFPVAFRLAVLFLWLAVQVLLRFRPSCCRCSGFVAIGAFALAACIASPPTGTDGVPFGFQVPVCLNGTAAVHTLCAPAVTSPSSPLRIDVNQSDGIQAGGTYRPVLLLPAGSYAAGGTSPVQDLSTDDGGHFRTGMLG